MTRPLPRWYRHRCEHLDRGEVRTFGGILVCEVCGDCGTVLKEKGREIHE